MTNFIRMLMRNVFVNVFKSDAVIRWAAIFRTPSSMFDRLLHMSKSESIAMSRSKSCNLCEAISNLLTVTMYLQDTPSRFHASTRTLAFHESQSCWAVRTQHNRPTWTLAQFAPLVSRCDSVTSSTNQCHQLGFTRTQTNHVLLLGRRIHGIPRVFNRTFDQNCNSRAAAPNQHRSSPRPNLAECPLLGRLLWLDRLDIKNAICQVSTHVGTAATREEINIKRLLRFLVGNPAYNMIVGFNLDVPGVARLVQDSVIVISFLKTEYVGSLEFAKKHKSLHNFVT